MRNDEGMTPSERELEAALGGLKPAPSAIDRDRVLFHAGRASVRRSTRLWQGLSSALAILLLASVLRGPFSTDSRQRPEVVARPEARVLYRPAAAVDQGQIEAFRHYVRTRRAVLDRGVEAIPASSGPEGGDIAPPVTRENLDDLLS